MVLEDAEINVTYLVEEVYLPRVLERRLDALGIINGTKIKLLNKKAHGAMVIFVRGTRFAIGSGIAENVKVRRVEA